MNANRWVLIILVMASSWSASADEGTRYSLYTPERRLLAESARSTDAAPAMEQEYVWFGNRPVAQFDGAAATLRWTFSDHLATPVLQTAANGTVAWRAEAEPYGSIHVVRDGPAIRQPLGFPGQEREDGSSELTYNIERWYRAKWGRYTQSDPIGLRGGVNLYAYAAGSPTRRVDPQGTVSITIPPTEYFPGTSDETISRCDGLNVLGCTRIDVHVQCDCHCTGGGWKPSLNITVSTHAINYSTDRPTPDYLIVSEEEKHVNLNLGLLELIEQDGRELESRTYSSKFACSAACTMKEWSIGLTMMLSPVIVHTVIPHPY